MGPEEDNGSAERLAGGGASGAVSGVFHEIAAALSARDKAAAVRSAVGAVNDGRVTIPELYRDVLTAILTETGAAWQRGTVAVWEEHLASATVRTVVEMLYPEVLRAKAAAPATGRSVLLACPPEESHDLGLRDEIVDAASRLGVHAVVMSSSTHYHRLAVRHAVDDLKRALPHVDVWVGGPAFAQAAEGWTRDEIVDLDALLGPWTDPRSSTRGEPAKG
jgi:hypothetical protein